MKNKILKLSVTLFTFFATVNGVYAHEDVGKISLNVSDEVYKAVESNDIKKIKELGLEMTDNGIVLNKISKTIATTTIYDRFDNIISINEKELTPEEELKLSNTSNYHVLSDGKFHKISMLDSTVNGIKTYETNSKTLELIYMVYTSGNYAIEVRNTWKTNPKYHSFDILGLRWENNMSTSSYSITGYETVLNGTAKTEYTEASSMDHMKKFSNGAGLSQNLYDDYIPFINQMRIVSSNYFGNSISGTYQHAKKDITLAKSRSYTISASGLGGVLKHNYASYYDAMQGISM